MTDRSAGRSGPNLVSILLRLEGALALAVAIIAYVHVGASWWLFALLILAPDLSALGYLGGPVLGARSYNAAHTYLIPVCLGAFGMHVAFPILVPIAIIWVAHIGADRLFGYGLKFPTGPKDNHITRLEGTAPGASGDRAERGGGVL